MTTMNAVFFPGDKKVEIREIEFQHLDKVKY